MTSIDNILSQTANTAFKAVVKVAVLVGLALVIGLFLWLSLLPKLTICGTSLGLCGLVGGAILGLALVIPFLMLWCARGYVLLKVLYELFKLYETPIVKSCAEQICKHRETILAAGKINHRRLSKQIPLPVRLIIKRLDLGPILEQLKQNPQIKPTELELPLKQRIEAQEIIQKPSFGWYWLLVFISLILVASVWWLV